MDTSENTSSWIENMSQWGELLSHAISESIKSPSVKAEMKSTVSYLALLLPNFFMKPEDPEALIKILQGKRDSIEGWENKKQAA